MVYPSPEIPPEPVKPDPVSLLPSSETKVRRVLIPVYMAVDVVSDDELQAQVLAAEVLRGMRIQGPVGIAQRVAVHSLVVPVVPE